MAFGYHHFYFHRNCRWSSLSELTINHQLLLSAQLTFLVVLVAVILEHLSLPLLTFHNFVTLVVVAAVPSLPFSLLLLPSLLPVVALSSTVGLVFEGDHVVVAQWALSLLISFTNPNVMCWNADKRMHLVSIENNDHRSASPEYQLVGRILKKLFTIFF